MTDDMHIQTIPGLRDRAEHSLALARQAREQSEAEIYDRLREESYDFLIDTLLVDQGTASLAMQRSAQGRTNSTAKDGHPGEASPNLALFFRVDGLQFRSYFVQAKAFQLGASDSKEFDTEVVYEETLAVEWRSPSSSYYKITDLATLGLEIVSHTR